MSTEDRAEGQADNVEGYALLRGILDEAYDQSARGKGHDRHANGRYFDQQPIMEIGRMVGPGFATGQVMKKAQEATSMAARGEVDAAVRELLGVIVYAASAVALVREKAPRADLDRRRCETASDRPFKVGDRVMLSGCPGFYGTVLGGEQDRLSVQWDDGFMQPENGYTWSKAEDSLIHVN